MRVALMTRAHRPAIAPVVCSPQRPTAPTVLPRAQGPRSVKSWRCRRLAAAMINQRSLRSSAARRHGPNPIRVDARAAVCPKRSSSPLLISSPQHPTDDPHGAVRCPLPISPRSRTTLIMASDVEVANAATADTSTITPPAGRRRPQRERPTHHDTARERRRIGGRAVMWPGGARGRPGSAAQRAAVGVASAGWPRRRRSDVWSPGQPPTMPCSTDTTSGASTARP